jgi:NhaP-type Na+/H+ and K+/H+ antiporter
MFEGMNLAILVSAGLITISIFTSLISFRVGAPLLLVFLGLGLFVGEDGLGLEFDNAPLAYFVGSLALAIILFDSGFLAVYVAGLVAGNARLRAANPLRRFQEGMTWLCQIVMFR